MSGRAILVVGPSWVGDTVLMHSLLQVLRRRHPERLIDVLAPAALHPLLALMPEARRAIVQPARRGALALGPRWRLASALRGGDYDWAIVLPGSFKSALAPFWAGIGRRTGYTGEARFGLINDRRAEPRGTTRTVDRFVALGLDPGEALPEEPPRPTLSMTGRGVDATLATLGLGRPNFRLLILCPGAEYGAAKRWPAAHFAALAATFVARGWAVWALGAASDGAAGAAIAASGAVDLTGRTDIGQAASLLSLADEVVCNDSGLMHVAAALGRRVVALFGSSSPERTPPLSPSATVLGLDLPCRPCYRRECPLGHLDCLRKITPDAVGRAVEAA